jgi:flagellar basal body rod protein FlgG
MPQFTRTTKALRASCLLGYLDSATHTNLTAKFGRPDTGYVDEDAGYDGAEWRFETPDGQIFSVYARHGAFRIAGPATLLTDQGAIEAFRLWIEAELGVRG